MTRISSLDGVRGIAIALVIMVHLHMLRGGFVGVDIFFVLSGFLISSLIIERISRNRTFDFGEFYVRRARRLLPALAACLLLSYILARLAGEDDLALIGIFEVALYISNYIYNGFPYLGHAWSLAVEVQFYLVWPIVLIMIYRFGRPYTLFVIGAMMLSILGWRIYLMHKFGAFGIDRTYAGLDTRSDSLLAGSLVAVVTKENYGKTNFTIFIMSLSFLCFVIIAVRPGRIWMHYWGFSAIAVSTAYIIYFVMHGKSLYISKGLSSRPLMFLGKVSYGLYLYHYPIFRFCDKTFSYPLFWKILLSFGTAILSWYLIESPAISFKKPRPTGASLS